jgi:signal peptidase II
MRGQTLRFLIIGTIILATVGCDQAAKHLARGNLEKNESTELLGDLVVLSYVENEGAFLSLGSTWPSGLRLLLFVVVSASMVLAAAVYLICRRGLDLTSSAALSLMVGGGVGNLIDRVLRAGYVTDFLSVGIGRIRTGIFNLADIFLIAGVTLLLLAKRKRPAADS